MERTTMSTARLWPTLALAALAVASGLLWGRDASASPGATERLSVASDGTQGNEDSWAGDISADGRFVAFTSSASNLVPGDTNSVGDVFVHDRLTGATERVSVASDGAEGNDWSGRPAINADGRFVAFSSDASNLVPGDTNNVCDTDGDGVYADNCRDVFVHDRLTGVTERVSVASTGAQGNGNSFAGAISADGRFVAFDSNASNLVSGDTNGFEDVFVHDRLTGVTERVSVASDGAEGNDWSGRPAISADGRFVAFSSDASNLSNLVPGDRKDPCIGGPSCLDVLAHDRLTGVTERVSVASDGAPAQGPSGIPAISADGRFVAFASMASNLVPNDVNGSVVDTFVHDRRTGVTELVSPATDGSGGDGWSWYPDISADGRFVAFESGASNLVRADTNDAWDIFVHDRCPGGSCPPPTAQCVPGQICVRVTDGLASPGGQVALQVRIDGVAPGSAGAATVDVTYDRNVFTNPRCTADPDGVLDSAFCNAAYDGNTVRVTGLSVSGVPGDVVLADLTFDVSPTVPLGHVTRLAVSVVTLVDAGGNPVPHGVQDGFVTIGRVGDVTCDGRVDAVDALFVLQYVVGLRQPADACPLPAGTLLLPAGDVNADGGVDAVDALFILQCVVGLPPGSGMAFCTQGGP